MKDMTTEFTVGAVALQGVAYATGVNDLNMKSIMAGCIVCLSLSALSNVDHRISTGLAAIIFFTIAVKVLPGTMEKIGLDSGGIKRDFDSSANRQLAEGLDKPSTKADGDLNNTPTPEKNPQFTPEKPDANSQLRKGL